MPPRRANPPPLKRGTQVITVAELQPGDWFCWLETPDRVFAVSNVSDDCISVHRVPDNKTGFNISLNNGYGQREVVLVPSQPVGAKERV